MSSASGSGYIAIIDPVDANIVQGTTTVNASVALPNNVATQMYTSSSVRKSVMIRNDTAGVVMYVGSSSGVSSGNGMPLNYGEIIIIDRAAGAAVWMYQNSGATVYPRFFLEFA